MLSNKYIRFVLIVVAVLLLLLFLLTILIRVPSVQNFAQQKVLQALSSKYEADWQIDELKINFIDQVEARGILLKDQASDTLLIADYVKINIGLFSLLNKTLSIDEISIENAKAKLYELSDGKMNFDFVLSESDNIETDDVTVTNDNGWIFDISTVNLEQIGLVYKTQKLDLILEQDLLEIDINQFDLENQIVALDQLRSQNSYTSLAFGMNSESSASLLPDLGWKVIADEIEMYHRLIVINGDETSRISELNIEAYNLDYQAESLMLEVSNLKGNYNDLVNLQKGTAHLNIYNNVVDASQVSFQTQTDQLLADQLTVDLDSKSYDVSNLNTTLSYQLLKMLEPYLDDQVQLIKGQGIRGKVKSLHYDQKKLDVSNIDLQYGEALKVKGMISIKANQGDFQSPDDIKLKIDFLKSDIHQLDGILNGFTIPDSLMRYSSLTASGRAKGNLQVLSLDHFSVKVDEAINATVNGIIRNLNRTDALSYDLKIGEATVNTQQIPYASMEGIDLPALGISSFKGTVTGDLVTLKLKGKLDSALGSANADVALGFNDGIDKLTYDGDISLAQFDLGTLLKDKSLGKITLTTQIKGQGTNIQEGNTNFKGIINDFDYNGYTYQTIKVDAHLQEGQIDGIVEIDDPNALLQYDGSVYLGAEKSTFDFAMQIDTINLQTLNLYSGEISLSGAVKSQLSLPLSDTEQQKVIIKDLNLSNLTQHFYEDSITITGRKKVDSTFVMVESDLMNLHLDGTYRVADLPTSLNDFVNTYIYSDTINTQSEVTGSNVHLYGEINTLLPFKILLVEDKLQSKPLSIDATIDFDQNVVDGKVQVDSFYYNEFFSEQLLLTAATNGPNIDFNVVGDMNTYNGTPINKLIIENKLNERMIESALSAFDKKDSLMVKLSTQSQFEEDQILVTVQDSFILNNNEWKVMNDNLIKIENSCVTVSNFELAKGLERIKVNSSSDTSGELSVSFESFNLKEFSEILLTNGSTVSGEINGAINIKDLCTAPYYIANIAVNDIVYDSTYVGLLKMTSESKLGNSTLITDLSLSGPNNNVKGSSVFNTSTGGLDVDLVFDSLQLLLLDPFLVGVIKDSKGHLSGDITVSGTTQKPTVLGRAKLQNIVTTIVSNNTKYSIDNHIINFNDTSIDIGVLDLYDDDGNTAKVSGKISHQYLQDINLALNLDTKKFTFLNTSSQDNPVFSGRVLLDAKGQITGPPSLLKINIDAKSLNGTDISISPYSAETFLREDFITYGRPQDFEDLTDQYLLKLAQEYPFDVTLLLNVTEESKLTIVVDPINGDKIEARGSGNIKILLDQYGEQQFYGRYTVKDGTYNFSYGSFITKEFKIQEGGSVTFNGSLLNAEMDIAAINTVYTTTYELLKDEVTLDESILNNSKSRTNVNVVLTLKGSLDNTEILLDIRIPELQSSSLISPVESKLAELREDPSELNNQVFGLLLFNSFLVSQNSSKGIGSASSNLALSSISELISSQLNKFAQNKIKGVDVSFNVNSYDSQYVNNGAGGNVTEVGLQVSKQLFNDRLSVSATGNVDLEENDTEAYSSVVGDFVLEYKLTEDGRFRIRVFSKTDYDRLLNENNNKNGVSLFFKKSFNSKRN